MAMSRVPSDRRLLYVGSDQPHKNLSLLGKGIAIIRSRMPEATLFLTLPESHPMCAIDGVMCLGVLSKCEVATAYSFATVLCQASIVETVGLPMLEAMSARTPVIAADRPYAHDVCRDAAIYFDPADVDDFAQVAIRVLSDKRLREGQIERGTVLVFDAQNANPYWEMVQALARLT